MPSPVVERMIELHRRLEAASKEGSLIDGWRPLRIDYTSRVVAVKTIDEVESVERFHPIGKWKIAYEYLEIQSELRALLFSELTSDQINEYREATGLPARESK
jgi:hypothetical protein